MIENAGFNLLLKTLLKNSAPVISVDELLRDRNVYALLDAREHAEYEVSHIPSARHVGFKQFDSKSVSHLSIDQPIAVYCSVGVRSEQIARQLINLGYLDVKNLYGGIFEWVNRELSVENGHGHTQEIHPYNRFWGKWITNNQISIRNK